MPFATLSAALMRSATVLLLIGVLFATDALAQHEPRRSGELIVRLAPDATIDDLLSHPVVEEYGFVPLRNLVPMLNIWLVGFDEPALNATGVQAEDILSVTRSVSPIQLAQFNHIVEHRGNVHEPPPFMNMLSGDGPNDPMFSQMWGLNNTGQTGGTPGADVDALAAWQINTGGIASNGETVVVAIVDSGFDLNHPDLPFWKNENESPTPNGQDDDGNGYIDDYHGWNAFNNNGNITSSAHGTHVAGTSAAKGNNELGVTGVNWDAAIMPIQGSSGNEAIVVAAYGYALTMRSLYNSSGGTEGAFVVATNASFGVNYGNPTNFPIWCGMYDELGQVGILSTGATMNINANVDTSGDVPTACPSDWLISVTNTTSSDQKNSGAAYGATTIELGAPGTGILSTVPGGGYSASYTGTSMATPHVTGAIALVISSMSPGRLAQYMADPANVALQVRQNILDGTDYIGIETVTGGRLNLHGALEQALLYDVPDLPDVPGGSVFAAVFDGTNSLTAGPSFRFPRGNDLSLSLWAQIHEEGTLAELSSEDGVAFRLEVVEHDDELVLRYMHEAENGTELSRVFHQRAVDDGVVHISMTRGGEPAAVRIFVDGQRVGSPFFYAQEPVGTPEDMFYVGNSADGESGIVAVLDEVRLFRDRLTTDEMRGWMHTTMAVGETPASLVAYYRFDADSLGFAHDFSNSGNGGDLAQDVRVISPFPVGQMSTLLFSAVSQTGSAGPQGARIAASVSSSLGSGNELALYVSDVSDALIEDETLPEGLMGRAETVWGAFVRGEVETSLTITVDSVANPEATGELRLLHRMPGTAVWTDVTDDWWVDGHLFHASTAEVFGEWTLGYTFPVSGEDGATPQVASLSTPYPNPFQSSTTLTLDLPQATEITVEVLDLLGRRVAVLHDGLLGAESHRLTLNGSSLAPGVYLVRATGENFSAVQRVTLVR